MSNMRFFKISQFLCYIVLVKNLKQILGRRSDLQMKIIEGGISIMETTEFSLELDVTEVSTEQDYVLSGVTSTGCCKN